MRVLIDSAIPFLRGVLEPFAEVVYLDNEEYVPISINYRDSFREYMDSMHPAQ